MGHLTMNDVKQPLFGMEVASTNRGVSLIQLKVANTVAFIITLALNGLSSAGVLSDYGVGTISDKYETKITPAGPAFSIWGPIYSIQALFVIYQFCWPKEDDAVLLHGVGFWFLSACLFNSLWIVTFVQGNTAAMWCSTALIIALLSSICKVYVNTGCWMAVRPGGIAQAVALDLHFSMYAGWVTVATIVNITVALTTVVSPEPATASACSVTMLVVALLLDTFIVVTRRDCVWGWVLCWASYWISVANHGDEVVVTGSIIVAFLIGLVSAAVGLHVAFSWFKARNDPSLPAEMSDSPAANKADYGTEPAGV